MRLRLEMRRVAPSVGQQPNNGQLSTLVLISLRGFLLFSRICNHSHLCAAVRIGLQCISILSFVLVVKPSAQ